MIFNQKGSVLILSVWVLLMLSIFASSIGFSARHFIDSTARFEIRSELRLIARSAVEKGLALLSQDNNQVISADYLGESWSRSEGELKDVKIGRGSFSVYHSVGDRMIYGIADEQSKINVNEIADATVFERLIKDVAGIGAEEAAAIGSAIVDWKDNDSDITGKEGAEADFYLKMNPPYTTRNAKLDALAELLFVRGVTYAIYDAVEPYLTIKTDGKINLNTAPKPVLIALGVDSGLADKIIQYRSGADQLERTSDDRYFKDFNTMTDTLKVVTGLSEAEATLLSELIGRDQFVLTSTLFSIQCEARIYNRKERLKVEALVDKQRGIRSWHEEFEAL